MALTATTATETTRAGMQSPPATVPSPALRIVSESWTLERAVFAPEELGWLAEEAQRYADLLGIANNDTAAIEIPHHGREPFRRLVHHPRLLHRASGVLRSPVAVARVLTTAARAAPRVALARGEVAMIVALGSSADIRIGDIVIAQEATASPLRFERAFVAIYRADPTSQLDTESDDCLWPSPWVVAG